MSVWQHCSTCSPNITIAIVQGQAEVLEEALELVGANGPGGHDGVGAPLLHLALVVDAAARHHARAVEHLAVTVDKKVLEMHCNAADSIRMISLQAI